MIFELVICDSVLLFFASRSYHDEEHYNSVRLKEDTCSGPARPITIKVAASFVR